jgi:hypothetical protein
VRGLISPSKLLDFCLAATGFGLAGGSLYLAFRMTLLASPAPTITGGEYLSIYARPKHLIPDSGRRPFAQGVDHTPVGSLPVAASRAPLIDFDLIDATIEAATVRTSHGRILRVFAGATLPGGGKVLNIRRIDGQWVVRTTKGTIR